MTSTGTVYGTAMWWRRSALAAASLRVPWGWILASGAATRLTT
eukprot:CAMPEP_0185844628 /NCGR_PEP_ID=MMETSP1354-20130828/751_1 /TAXON_ID=708628 /ORGANISM="Erythrolobus madagascarensis, Strain CCMP3276" /LENGTH=42 /DNA_ID= /DNA_START= /DNA_END= /DNA_ORIENTATION=